MSPAARRIDLNGDLGEWDGEGPPPPGELLLMEHLTSVNVACGGHAGDAGSMRATVVAALERGLAIGAHPSFPDREGFGRRPMRLPPAEIRRAVAGQIVALAEIAAAAGARLAHVKPHGALYHLAASDPGVAGAVADAVAGVDPALAVVARSGGALVAAASRRGLAAVSEVFCDRAYDAAGGLVARGLPGSLLTDPHLAAARLLGMLREGSVEAIDGTRVAVTPETACIHGDTPGAAAFAGVLRAALVAAGVTVKAPTAIRG
jgi:UPF0271 protein